MRKDGFPILDNYHELLYKYDATFIIPRRCSGDFGMYGPFCNPRPSPSARVLLPRNYSRNEKNLHDL